MENYFLIAEAVIVNIAICGGVSYALYCAYKELDRNITSSKSMLTLEIEMLNRKVVDLQKNQRQIVNDAVDSPKIFRLEKMHDSC